VKGNAHRHKSFVFIWLCRRGPDLRTRRIIVCYGTSAAAVGLRRTGEGRRNIP